MILNGHEAHLQQLDVIRVYGVPQGKSAAMMYEQFGDLKYKYRNKEFWCRGYYVDTVGKMRAELRSTSRIN